MAVSRDDRGIPSPHEGIRRAVFLDRDGVLIEDRGPLADPDCIAILPGVPEALARFRRAGYRLLVVSNQTVVSRGLLDERAMFELQGVVEGRIRAAGGPALDGFYPCVHHPSATRPEYRRQCDCRKPAPGLLRRAAEEHGVTLEQSLMVGDRPSDVAAGRAAGCATVQLRTGQHEAPPIEVPGGFEPVVPDFTFPDLLTAARHFVPEEGAS